MQTKLIIQISIVSRFYHPRIIMKKSPFQISHYLLANKEIQKRIFAYVISRNGNIFPHQNYT
jgi:hypothetical protein